MIPFILGALGVVAISELTKKSRVSKMAHGGEIDTKRKMFLHDAVLYKGDLLYITNKNGVLGLANLKRGAWGSDYPFIPISEVNMDDVTDMMGRKISIEGYSESGREMAIGGLITSVEDIFPKEKMLNLLRNTKFKTFDSKQIKDIFYITEKYNPFDKNFALQIDAYPCLIKINKISDGFEVQIGKDTGLIYGFSFGNWDYIFEMPILNFLEFEKGLKSAIADKNIVLYSKWKTGNVKDFYFKGNMAKARIFAKRNGYEEKKSGEHIYFSNPSIENWRDESPLYIGTFTDRQIQENGKLKELAIGGLIPTAPNGEEFAEGGEILKWKVDENGFKPTYIIDKENEPDYFQKFGEDKKYAWGVTYGYNVIDEKLGKYSVLWFLTNKQDLINKYPNIIEDVDNLTSIEYVGDLEALSDLKVIFVDNLKDAKKLASEIFNQLNLGKSISEDSIIKKYNKIKISKYAKGGVLSNKLRIVNLEFEDSTDRKLGRYDFSFETIDSEGASVLDYDGYIIESAAESRMPDEIEWGLNVPEDWEGAEDYILDSFYEWKSKKYAKGGGVGNETKNWFSIKFKLPDGRISWTTTYSSMGEKYAKNEVLEDFGATEIIEIRQATKNEINYAVGDSMDYAKGGSISLETFDINDLDAYEKFTYNYMLSKNPKMSKSDILRVIINNVDGDYSQLSPKLSKVAKKLK